MPISLSISNVTLIWESVIGSGKEVSKVILYTISPTFSSRNTSVQDVYSKIIGIYYIKTLFSIYFGIEIFY